MEVLKVKHTQLCQLLMVAVTVLVAAAADQTLPTVSAASLPGCKNTCGDVQVPYPFGIGISSTDQQHPCFLLDVFNLTCGDDSKLYWGNIQVLNISLQGQMDVLFNVSWNCYLSNGNQTYQYPSIRTAAFSISSKENKFITVGCDSYGYLNSVFGEERYSTGCLTRCYGYDTRSMIDDGTCSGIGCCEVDIPPRMWNITVQAAGFNSTEYLGDCSYSFVAKQGNYTFNSSHLQDFPYTEFPLVIDWTVYDKKKAGYTNCSIAKGGDAYACSQNSSCYDEDTGLGYRCRCNPGYVGNPYHPNGCIDIDECKTSNHTCIDENHCLNTVGSHTCFCPHGQSGNGTREGGCNAHQRDLTIMVVIGVGAGFIVLFVGISSLYLMYQKRKQITQKEKLFKENGGLIMLQKLRTREDSSQPTRIFREDELKMATNNYDESLIIGKGGYGTVYKGFLPDKRIVAIKKSKVVDKSQSEQFINEVIVVSQINHRNVVKLLGCCLETEIPLLVYEFISNGTLFDFLHTKGKTNNVAWKTRLRIATETAGALSYLHSAASVPIIHRDVKSANILLDDTYTAKVSDFGASRLVPLDQTDIATMVQGTIGYLDPEYMQTHQLTEKSDVYSFGVVLAELLTGEKPISFDRTEEKRSLAMHFLSCLKEDRMFDVLQVGILDEENKQEIKEVSILAAKCLRLKGEERPSMKEVAMELEGIRRMEKQAWINTDINLQETQYLLHETQSSIYEHGDSSSYQNIGYDSIRDHSLIAFDDGR